MTEGICLRIEWSVPVCDGVVRGPAGWHVRGCPERRSRATFSGMQQPMSMSVSSTNAWTSRVGRGLHWV